MRVCHAARATASRTVLVPTSFGEFHGSVTVVSSGEVLEEFTELPAMKDSAEKARGTSVDCTFTISGTFPDPDLGLLHFEASGTVSGFTTPAK